MNIQQQIRDAKNGAQLKDKPLDNIKQMILDICQMLSIPLKYIPEGSVINLMAEHLKQYSRYTHKEYLLAVNYVLSDHLQFKGTYNAPFGIIHLNMIMGQYKEFARREYQESANIENQNNEEKNRQARKESALFIYKHFLDGTHETKIHAEVLYMIAYKYLIEISLTTDTHAKKFYKQAEATINEQTNIEKMKLIGKGSLTLARLVKPKESDQEIQMYRLALLDLYKKYKYTIKEFEQKLK